MAHYFLGVDIGGSKSQALIADDTGQVVGGVLLGMEQAGIEASILREPLIQSTLERLAK